MDHILLLVRDSSSVLKVYRRDSIANKKSFLSNGFKITPEENGPHLSDLTNCVVCGKLLLNDIITFPYILMSIQFNHLCSFMIQNLVFEVLVRDYCMRFHLSFVQMSWRAMRKNFHWFSFLWNFLLNVKRNFIFLRILLSSNNKYHCHWIEFWYGFLTCYPLDHFSYIIFLLSSITEINWRKIQIVLLTHLVFLSPNRLLWFEWNALVEYIRWFNQINRMLEEERCTVWTDT